MLLLKNASLYGEERKDILIGNDKIIQIADSLDYSSESIDVIDLNGQTIVPALIDQHVHITGGGGEGGMASRCPELAINDVLDGGVGTIVGLLGTDGLTRTMEALLAKTKELREYGFQAYCLTGAYQVPTPTFTDSIMKDVCFIDEIIGAKVALNDHRSSHISYEELKRLAADVRMAGLIGKKPGVVHIHMGIGKHGLKMIFELIENENIPAYVFRPTHMGKHIEEGLKLANLGSYIDFTTYPEAIKGATSIDQALKTYPENTVTFSSDSNGSMPRWNDKKEIIGIDVARITSLHETVRCLVKEFGYTLKEAIRPCTETVAKSLLLYPKVGAVKEGSYANLLLLDDELNIESFLLNGEFVRKEYRNIMNINFVE